MSWCIFLNKEKRNLNFAWNSILSTSLQKLSDCQRASKRTESATTHNISTYAKCRIYFTLLPVLWQLFKAIRKREMSLIWCAGACSTAFIIRNVTPTLSSCVDMHTRMHTHILHYYWPRVTQPCAFALSNLLWQIIHPLTWFWWLYLCK